MEVHPVRCSSSHRSRPTLPPDLVLADSRAPFWPREGYEDLPHFGAHKLRATCASMLGYALRPKHVMLDFLGHEQETTTIKHYLRAFREAKARAREGIAVEEQILQARSLFEPDVADRLGERWIGSRSSGAVRAGRPGRQRCHARRRSGVPTCSKRRVPHRRGLKVFPADEESRRPDSNRGPLHYERRAYRPHSARIGFLSRC
jgi:hypothetical protein